MAAHNKLVLANVNRLKDHMVARQLSAVVIRSGKNFAYLSGVSFPGTLARHLDLTDSPRDVYLVWPLEGEPIIVTSPLGKPVIERDSWISQIEVVEDYAESPLVKLVNVIKELGLETEKIGLEKNYISAMKWAELSELLPGNSLSDCTDMMNSVRWVKTEAEILLIKRAADIQDEVYLEVFPTISPGDSERNIHSRLVQSCIQKGCHFVHGILTSSRNPSMYLGESDLVVEQGDIIRTDYVSYLQGYPGHQSRMVCVGQPTKEQERTYQKYLSIYLNIIDKCQIGTKFSELYFYGREKLLDNGFPHNPSSFLGHSIGAWWHQQEPFLVSGWCGEIEEGMVLAIEPYVDYWHLQDLVHITREGPQILSSKFDISKLFVVN